jgi:hypothetical protein
MLLFLFLTTLSAPVSSARVSVRGVGEVPGFIQSATVAALGRHSKGEETAGALLRRLEEFEILDDLEDKANYTRNE